MNPCLSSRIRRTAGFVLLTAALVFAGCFGKDALTATEGEPALPSEPDTNSTITVNEPPVVQVVADAGSLTLSWPSPPGIVTISLDEQPVVRRAVASSTATFTYLEPNTTYQASWTANMAGLNRSILATTGATPYQLGDPADALLRPGARFVIGGGACTIGALLRNPDFTELYVLTAGHCVTDRIGHDASLGDAGRFGEAIELYQQGMSVGHPWILHSFFEWGLISVDTSWQGGISPQLLHFGGPTGIAGPGSATSGDELCLYGNGNQYRSLDDSNLVADARARCGRLDGYRTEDYNGHALETAVYYLTTDVGDSGSGLIAAATGELVSIHTGTAGTRAMGQGSSACAVMQDVLAAGFQVALWTAPLVPDAKAAVEVPAQTPGTFGKPAQTCVPAANFAVPLQPIKSSPGP